MTLQSSGPISLGNVRTELGTSGAISLGSSIVRELAGVLSGSISLADLYGKSAEEYIRVVNTEFQLGGSQPSEKHNLTLGHQNQIVTNSRSYKSRFYVSGGIVMFNQSNPRNIPTGTYEVEAGASVSIECGYPGPIAFLIISWIDDFK